MNIWEWYVPNAKKVEALCARMGNDPDEMYGRAIDAMMNNGDVWLAKYDSTKSSINTYLLMQIGYAIRDKNGQKEKERLLTDQEAESLSYTNSEPVEDDDKLLAVLCHLSGYDQWLITARHVHKISFTLIGERVGMTKGMVRAHYLRAIERAKRYVK